MPQHAAEVTTVDRMNCKGWKHEKHVDLWVPQGGVGGVLPHAAEVNKASWPCRVVWVACC